MKAARTSVQAARHWRTCSRSRAFYGAYSLTGRLRPNGRGRLLPSAGAPWAFQPSCGYKAGTRPHVADSSFGSAWRHRVAMFA